MSKRTCRICKVKKPFAEMFYTNCNKAYCSPECGAALALELLEKKKEKQENNKRKEIRIRKDKLNETLPNWKKKVQREFNLFIRLRDYKKPCISCGVTSVKSYHMASGWDAGHYRSVGSCPELRFNPWNCHKQCVRCNQWKSGNAIDYRIRLIQRIGQRKVSAIERNHSPKRYTVEDLKKLLSYYKELNKKLKAKHDSRD